MSSPDEIRSEAEALLRSGNPLGALRLLQPLLTQSPQDASVQIHVGRCHLRVGQLREAEASFRTAVALAAGDPIANYYLGLTLERQATSAFEAAVKLKPDFAEAKAKLAVHANSASSKANAPIRQAPVGSEPAARSAPRWGTIIGKVTYFTERPDVYGKRDFTFGVQPQDGSALVHVRMNGRPRGAPVEKDDIVELRGKPSGGVLKTREVRNVTKGDAPFYVVRAWY